MYNARNLHFFVKVTIRIYTFGQNMFLLSLQINKTLI